MYTVTIDNQWVPGARFSSYAEAAKYIKENARWRGQIFCYESIITTITFHHNATPLAG